MVLSPHKNDQYEGNVCAGYRPLKGTHRTKIHCKEMGKPFGRNFSQVGGNSRLTYDSLETLLRVAPVTMLRDQSRLKYRK